MTANGHDYGALVDRKKGRYQCNYCGKLITGHTRLKYHLGGIRGDVTPCPEVPEGVKETLRDELLEKKFVKARKDFGELSLPNLPLKRQRHELDKQDVVQSSRNGRSVKPKSEMGSLFENNFKAAAASVFPDDGQVDSPLGEAQKCIGRFFYETGVDFEMSESPSFLNMIRSINRTVRIPTCQQLKGQVLQDAVNEMQEYTSDIKSVWAATGCSILLDGWVDSNGRKLLNILIDCAKGTIYHQCSDISSIDDDVAEMEAYLGGVIEEVGVDNVVQIVTYSSSSFMEDIGKRINDKYKTVFWTVSASHCIELMLRKLETMKDLKEILAKAKTITEFVYDNESVLKLVRDFCSSDDLVEPSKIRSIVPFLTLENMVMEEENLQRIFLSSDWKTLDCAKTSEGQMVADLVGDKAFWDGALVVLKAIIPLVKVLKLINNSNKPLNGYIYDTIDQAKETIRSQFQNKKSQYMRFWEAIDEIWNKYLHSPLHAAGYFLNPSIFYSSDFFADAEVSCGLCCCIVRMTGNLSAQDLIMQQIEEYRMSKGLFGIGSGEARLRNTHPALWWSEYGTQCPDSESDM
ncbi:unnamed protein product [Cuscuta campestris]|uniref:DUF659 domain-containing protein n=1 Tax=Cuscuta campestris TaxID=132261 RepID=A0A484L0E2_9ASTE|nr:unnamed protein product [Cuscuta campestris]